MREIEHASSLSCTLIEEHLSNQSRFDVNEYWARSFGRLEVPTINANIAKKLEARDQDLYRKFKNLYDTEPNPLFNIVIGNIESWEIV